jgi:hypothetical protein
MTEWIRVEDALPEIDKCVITWNTHCARMGYYDPHTAVRTGWRDDECIDMRVTHWMPLPNPPQNQFDGTPSPDCVII